MNLFLKHKITSWMQSLPYIQNKSRSKIAKKKPTPLQIAKYDIKQKIISELANIETRIILFSVNDESKTATDISHETRLPLSTIYRKISTLQDLTLIENVKEDFSPSGKVEKYYKSRIKRARIIIKSVEPKLTLDKNKK